MKTYSRTNKIHFEQVVLPPEYIQSCRLCLSYISSNSSPVDIFTYDKLTLSKIKFCIGIDVLEEESTPSKLCGDCYSSISSFYCFKKMCISSEIKLKKYSRRPRSKESELLLLCNEAEIKNCSQSTNYKFNRDVISLVQEQCNAVAFLLEEENIHPDAPDEVILQIKREIINSEQPEESVRSEHQLVCNAVEKQSDISLVKLPTTIPESRDIQNIRFISCEECNKIFTRTDMLIAHEKTEHNINRLYCNHCSKSFVSKTLIESHMRSHSGIKPYQCTICSKTFSKKEFLNRHFRRLHCEKRFECEKCPKIFTSREGLKSHFFTHHTVRRNEERLKCKYCAKSFCHSSGLSRHLLTHTGILFTCKKCQKGFSDGSCLRRHTLIVHSDEIHDRVQDCK